jgi:hypothetical protein
MHYKDMRILFVFPIVMCLPVALISLTGCEVGSASDVVRSVNLNVSGVYSNPNGGSLVERNSGDAIIRLNVRQNGDQIEAVDNNNQVFRGSVTEAGEGKLTLNLEGRTTSGKEAIFSGTFTVTGTTSIMTGTFIEEEGFSSFFGQATVAGTTNVSTNDRLSTVPQADWSGCCSGHNGVKTNSAGQVFVTSTGFARCNDGTASPTCSENNR